MKTKILSVFVVLALGFTAAQAQVNSGSNGSDGALDYSSLTNLGYSTNIVINMADHPTGIYQYTYVNIPANVTVTFNPNANNTPVYWLVQNNVTVNGVINLSGQSSPVTAQGIGGPGGGNGGNGGATPTSGQGYGGGSAVLGKDGANASYATLGETNNSQIPPGMTYGNGFLIPLIGGSGGGGSSSQGGGGGGGAILVAASGAISVNGQVYADGGSGANGAVFSGAGSGGAVRLVAAQISGSGYIATTGGLYGNYSGGGSGFVRFDSYANEFAGNVSGQFTFGSQVVVSPSADQSPQLTVTSVGGVSVSPSPTGQLSTPDAFVSAQQYNPVPIVVSCANLPLGSLITVSVTPANGSPVSATGYNNTGTLSSSTATISINIPHGGGLIYATAATSN